MILAIRWPRSENTKTGKAHGLALSGGPQRCRTGVSPPSPQNRAGPGHEPLTGEMRTPPTVGPLCHTLNGNTEREVACESRDRWRSELVGLRGWALASFILQAVRAPAEPRPCALHLLGINPAVNSPFLARHRRQDLTLQQTGRHQPHLWGTFNTALSPPTLGPLAGGTHGG